MNRIKLRHKGSPGANSTVLYFGTSEGIVRTDYAGAWAYAYSIYFRINETGLSRVSGAGMTNYPSQTLFVYTNIPMISHEGRYDYTSVASRDLIERGLSDAWREY